MKHSKLLFTSVLLGTTLVGCKDATAKISNKNELLFKVEKQTVTNEDIYKPLMNAAGFNLVNSAVEQVIFDKEVTVTDEMKKAADKKLEEEKSKMGANFDTTIKQYYMPYGVTNEQEFYDKILLATEKRNALTKKYLEQNLDSKFKTYKPMKVQIVAIDDEEKSKKALEAAKNGSSFEQIANEYGNTTTYKGNIEIVNQSSKLPSAVWAKISSVTDSNKLIEEVITDSSADSSSPKYYLVKVIDTNALENFKDEAIDSILTSSSSLSKDAMIHYLEKYNFHIYDINIYNSYKSQNPTYLVQDKK